MPASLGRLISSRTLKFPGRPWHFWKESHKRVQSCRFCSTALPLRHQEFSEMHLHFLRHTPISTDVPIRSETCSHFQRSTPIFRNASLFSGMHLYFQTCNLIFRDAPLFPEMYLPIFRDAPLFPEMHSICRDAPLFSEIHPHFQRCNSFSETHPYFQRCTPIFRDRPPILRDVPPFPELHLKPKSQPQTLEKPSVTPCSEFTPEPPPKAISPSQWPQRTTKCLCNICRIKSCSALHLIWAGCNVAVSAWWLCTVMAVHSDGCARWWLCMVMVVHGGSCARWLCMVVVVQGGGCALCLLAMHCVC